MIFHAPEHKDTGPTKSGRYAGGSSRATHLRINDASSRWYTLQPAVSIVVFIVGVLIAATIINAFVFQSYYVEGTSMTPTLQDDDRLIIDKTGHSFAELRGEDYIPERGDIIVLNSTLPDPSHAGGYEQLIKRVIGLPGERVVVENGAITVYNRQHPNGFNADQSLNLELAPTFTTERIETHLSAHEVFVTGDNRGPGGSLDSRSFGPIDASAIEGKLWARIFPLSDARMF